MTTLDINHLTLRFKLVEYGYLKCMWIAILLFREHQNKKKTHNKTTNHMLHRTQNLHFKSPNEISIVLNNEKIEPIQ